LTIIYFICSLPYICDNFIQVNNYDHKNDFNPVTDTPLPFLSNHSLI